MISAPRDVMGALFHGRCPLVGDGSCLAVENADVGCVAAEPTLQGEDNLHLARREKNGLQKLLRRRDRGGMALPAATKERAEGIGIEVPWM